MEKGEFDFRTFAQLRGKEVKKPVSRAMLVSLVLLLAGVFLLLSNKYWMAMIF